MIYTEYENIINKKHVPSPDITAEVLFTHIGDSVLSHPELAVQKIHWLFDPANPEGYADIPEEAKAMYEHFVLDRIKTFEKHDKVYPPDLFPHAPITYPAVYW